VNSYRTIFGGDGQQLFLMRFLVSFSCRLRWRLRGRRRRRLISQWGSMLSRCNIRANLIDQFDVYSFNTWPVLIHHRFVVSCRSYHLLLPMLKFVFGFLKLLEFMRIVLVFVQNWCIAFLTFLLINLYIYILRNVFPDHLRRLREPINLIY